MENDVNVDIIVANALKTVFTEDKIYHDILPENGNYPMVMYTDISESPAMHADGKLYAKEHIIRVTIVTSGNLGINALKNLVYDAMVNAGFMWMNTAKTHEKNEFYTSLDFSYGYAV